jgi:hypothetical protein
LDRTTSGIFKRIPVSLAKFRRDGLASAFARLGKRTVVAAATKRILRSPLAIDFAR